MKQDVEETELPEEKKKKNYNSRETANLFSCLKGFFQFISYLVT